MYSLPGSQVQTLITPRIFGQNLKSFLGVSSGTRRRCLIKKTRVKKSRDTVPLKVLCCENEGRSNEVLINS